MLEKVVRVTKEEFELEGGTVHQIIPPLQEEYGSRRISGTL